MVQLSLSKQLVLGELLAIRAGKQPNKEFLIFKERRFTYKQVEERVNRFSNALIALGIAKGDKVGIISMNSNEVFETYFALAKIGAVAVPNNFRYTAREYVYQLNNSDAKALVFSENYKDIITSIRTDLPKVKNYICIGETDITDSYKYEELLQENPETTPEVYVDDDDPAFILFTSGTMGKPKGAVLTHKNIYLRGVALNFNTVKMNLKNYVLLYPLFHVAGLDSAFSAIYRNCKIVILDDLSLENILTTVQNEKIGHLEMVTTLWKRLATHPNLTKYDLSSLKMGSLAAAPGPEALKSKIFELFPDIHLEDAFGMTETSGDGILCTSNKNFMTKLSSIGLPSVTMDVRVVDKNDKDVSVGEVGEVLLRGPSVMKEYYKQPEATAEALKGGWYHTGDLVRQDEDGYYYLVGRKKDLIISGGENIYPVEIEEILCSHPRIADAAVIGVPDSEWGESVRAIIILKPDQKMQEADVIEYCKTRMASYKKPRSVEFVKAFPLNASGKVLKRVLRAHAKTT